MSTKIDIALESLQPDEVDSATGALGRVFHHDTGQVEEIIIPTGPNRVVKSIDLEPGQYTIEARLPSGSLARQHLQVSNQPHIPVSFTFGDADSGLEAMAASEVRVSTLSVSRLHPECWMELSSLARARVAPTLHEIEEAVGSQPGTRIHATFETSRKSTFRLRDDSHNYDVQQIAAIEREGVVELMPLPIPWRTRTGMSIDVEIAVPVEPAAPLELTVRDPDFKSMIGYLGAGAIDDAQKILESNPSWDAIETLRDKLENPFAASIAGCTLVLSETSGESRKWDSWLDTLAQTFAHLPDAAIVQATRLMRRRSPDLDRARDFLTRASKMGLPIFAPIVNLFLEGLTTLVSDPDFDSSSLSEELFKAVRIVLMRMQPGQPLTVIRLGGRSG